LPKQHLSVPSDTGGNVQFAGNQHAAMLRDVGSGPLHQRRA